MNLKKLTTLLFAGVTAATPLVTSAQNPTILQGNYVSNVFGQANFVLNPNAQTNVANVTVTNATRTRSTTTPLVATSEFNVTVTSANGTITWATRSFDAGMKNQNCEARFTYRGFQATSKAQIKQGANVVAELTLTPSATDPRIASINFPCGDLSAATTFVITDSATLSGTNEIGGIYVGLATNQANVAQAENVLQVGQSVAQTVASGVVTVVYNDVWKDLYGSYNASTGVFTATRAGTYIIDAAFLFQGATWTAGQYSEIRVVRNGNPLCRDFEQISFNATQSQQNRVSCQVELSVGQTIRVDISHNSTTKTSSAQYGYTDMQIARLPSSSELVVTPETQNVWGGVRYTGTVTTQLHAGSAEPTAYSRFDSASWNASSYKVGAAQPSLSNSGNTLGFSMPNLPVGKYKVSIHGKVVSNPPLVNGTIVNCSFEIFETTQSAIVTRQSHLSTRFTTSTKTDLNTTNTTNSFFGIFDNTSVGTRDFVLRAAKLQDTDPGNGAICQAETAIGGAVGSQISFLLEPLDNASNSALYVQGPVKAAATGTAIPAGYVGEEKISYPSPTATTSADVPVVITGSSLTLEPGVWDISYKATVTILRNPASTVAAYCRSRILENGSLLADTESMTSFYTSLSSIGNNVSNQTATKRVLITATKTYTLDLTANQNNTVATCFFEQGNITASISGDDAVSYIRAVRIN